MNEKNSLLDTIATMASFGFCVLGMFVVAGAVMSRRENRETLPEHIVTSRGRRLFLEVEPDNVYEFQTVAPRRMPDGPHAVAENDASQTRHNID